MLKLFYFGVRDKEWKTFVDKGEVSDHILSNIAKKVMRKDKLSIREEGVFFSKTKEINDYIIKLVA